MNYLQTLSSIAMMGSIFDMKNRNNPLRPEDIVIKNRIKPIPKGCQRYYFNEEGECSEGRSKVHFDAINKKSAYRKYDKWLKNLQL